MPTFLWSFLHVIMFVLITFVLYVLLSFLAKYILDCNLICIFIQLSCLYKRNSIHVRQSSKFDISNMYTSVNIVLCTKQPEYLLHFVVPLYYYVAHGHST